jgi:hypothetical protein
LKLFDLDFLTLAPVFHLGFILLVFSDHREASATESVVLVVDLGDHVRNTLGILVFATLAKLIEHRFDLVHFLLKTVHVLGIGSSRPGWGRAMLD